MEIPADDDAERTPYTYALKLMIAFEMNPLEGHLRLHIVWHDQIPSAATTAAPASVGTRKTRRVGTSPTTSKRPRKYLPTIPQGLQDRADELQGLSILHPVESGLAGEMFPILSAGVGASSALAPGTAATADESEEVHSRTRHDTHHHYPHHHHHPQHHRRSRRNSTVNQGGTTSTPRNNNSANRRATEPVETNPNAHAHQPQRGSVPKGDGMHIMPGESLAHIFPAALRVALGLPAVAAGSDASGGSSDSEGEEGKSVSIDVDGVIATGNRREKRALVVIFKTGVRGGRQGMMVRKRRVI